MSAAVLLLRKVVAEYSRGVANRKAGNMLKEIAVFILHLPLWPYFAIRERIFRDWVPVSQHKAVIELYEKRLKSMEAAVIAAKDLASAGLDAANSTSALTQALAEMVGMKITPDRLN